MEQRRKILFIVAADGRMGNMKCRLRLGVSLLLFILFGLLGADSLRADAASHRQAAEKACEALEIDKISNQAIHEMVEMQFKELPPSVAKYKARFRAFYQKCLSWPAIREHYIETYTKEFTEKELLWMAKFYNSPFGKKMLHKIPKLMEAGIRFGQDQVKKNERELEQIVSELMKELQQNQPAMQ